MQLTEDKDSTNNTATIPAKMAEASAECLRRHIAFALYRLPGEDCVFIANPGLSDQTGGNKSLRIVMWNEVYSDGIIVSDEMDETQLLASIANNEISEGTTPEIFPWPLTTSRIQYDGQLHHVIQSLRKRGGKTVMSRVVYGDTPIEADQWVSIAQSAFESNPGAMCCLYYTPETGAWLCASPELLLDADGRNGRLHTVALAGTRKPEADNATKAWIDKDSREHELVKEYIDEKLSILGVKNITVTSSTSKAGEVEHLKTTFEGEMPPNFTSERFLDTMSPTPALCGYPKDEALKEIAETEVHPRYCYGGYIAVESPARSQAYVNIRCVHFNETGMTLYAGGGIMPESNAASEWRESEAKLMTIMRSITKGINK